MSGMLGVDIAKKGENETMQAVYEDGKLVDLADFAPEDEIDPKKLAGDQYRHEGVKEYLKKEIEKTEAQRQRLQKRETHYKKERFVRACDLCKKEMFVALGQFARFHGECRKEGRKKKL